MISILIFTILSTGLIYALVPKSWIEKHIIREIDPNDNNF